MIQSRLFKLAAACALATCFAQTALAQSAASAPAAAPAATAPAAAAAAPAAAGSTDEAMAAKLKGQWAGRWEIGNFGGKFVLIVTSVEGATLKGEGQWYGTASGDTKEALKTATVKDGVLLGEQTGGTTFKLKLKDDNTLDGSWDASGYSGPLSAKRQ